MSDNFRFAVAPSETRRAHAELTAAVFASLRAQARRDEATIERWLLGGMKGRLRRMGRDADITFDPDDGHVGEWVLEIREGAL